MKKSTRNKKYQSFVRKDKDVSHKKNGVYNKLRIRKCSDPVKKALDILLTQYPDVTIGEIQNIRFLRRITLNYIRHNHTNYDRMLIEYNVSNFNTKLCEYKKWSFKEHVNNRISKQYANELKLDKYSFAVIFNLKE